MKIIGHILEILRKNSAAYKSWLSVRQMKSLNEGRGAAKHRCRICTNKLACIRVRITPLHSLSTAGYSLKTKLDLFFMGAWDRVRPRAWKKACGATVWTRALARPSMVVILCVPDSQARAVGPSPGSFHL